MTKKIVYTGPAVILEPNETGWRDTVRVDPMTVTRIIVKFEHEDNEMMRPFEVLPG